MKRSENRNAGGFTLIELLVSIGIGMVVLAAVTTTFMSQTRFYSAQEQVNEMEQNAPQDSTATAQVLADNITDFTFSYLNANGASTTATADNRQVAINITARTAILLKNLPFILREPQGERLSARAQAERSGRNHWSFSVLAEPRRSIPRGFSAESTTKPEPNYTSNGGYRIHTVTATNTPTNLAL